MSEQATEVEELEDPLADFPPGAQQVSLNSRLAPELYEQENIREAAAIIALAEAQSYLRQREWVWLDAPVTHWEQEKLEHRPGHLRYELWVYRIHGVAIPREGS